MGDLTQIEGEISDHVPGKRSFFKYASPETTLKILENRTIRYSSPLKFNDPFDVQAGLHFDFDLNTLHGKILDKLHEFATATEEPQVDKDEPWGKIALKIRENYPIHGFPRSNLEKITAPSFAWLVNEIRTTQQQIQEQWQKTLLPSMRVFCVSEERDNLLMWAHYAKDHTGVVFEFLSLPAEDNPLSIAEQVIYEDQPAPFYTEAEWIDNILLNRELDRDIVYRRYARIKSTHWKYEREWRVWYPLLPTPNGLLHEDMPIRQSELAAIYIGCKAEEPFVKDVVNLTRKAFHNVKLYQVHKRQDAYALEYTEI